MMQLPGTNPEQTDLRCASYLATAVFKRLEFNVLESGQLFDPT
jgi:hypothetical protein